MGRYSRESDNVAKSCKARGPNLRVHFKVRDATFGPRTPRLFVAVVVLFFVVCECVQLKSVDDRLPSGFSLLHCC